METPYFELNEEQCREMIKLADFTRKDVFYDLGAGTGKVVLEVAKHSPVRKSIGIESMKKLHEKARLGLIREHSAGKIKNLKRVDFWLGSLYNEDEDVDGNLSLDYSDATVVFASTDEVEEDVDDYEERMNWNKIRLIKKDIPLVGYKSIANRSNTECWLFLSKPPHKRIKKREWIRSVSPNFDTIDDIYDYYYNQLCRRFERLILADGVTKDYARRRSKKEATSSLLGLKMLVNSRF